MNKLYMFIGKTKKKYDEIPIQFKASLWFLICSVLQKGISVITTPIFTRLLTPFEYGEYNVFNSWMGILSVFITLKLAYGVYAQGIVKFESNKYQFTSALQGLTLAITSLFFALYLMFSNFWNNMFGLSTVEMVLMFIIIWAGAVVDFWSTEQKLDYKYKHVVIVTLIVSIVQPLLSVVAVLNSHNKVLARIFVIAMVNFIAYGWAFFYHMKKGKVFFSKKYWLYALGFNIPLIPHYLSQTVLSSADRIMINDIVGSSEAGIYSLAYTISLLVTLFNSAIMQTMSPWMYRKIRDKNIDGIDKVAYISLLGLSGINLLLIAFAPEIIKIFAPDEYFSAIWIIPPVAMSTVFMFSYDLFAKYEFYYEKTNFIMIASVLAAGLNIVLNFVFIKKFGFIAAGYTTLLCYVISTIGHYIFMNRICLNNSIGRKPYNLKTLNFIYFGFMGLGFIIMATYNFFIIRYFFIGLIILFFLCNLNKIKIICHNLMNY